MLRYTYVLAKPGDNGKACGAVRVELDRPAWWADATHRERRKIERKALNSQELQSKLATGLVIAHVKRPVCECVVQTVEPRDPFYKGAAGTCRRCYGPLPHKGKRKRFT